MGGLEIPETSGEGEKDPHPQDKVQPQDFSKGPTPLYYRTPPCLSYHRLPFARQICVLGMVKLALGLSCCTAIRKSK